MKKIIISLLLIFCIVCALSTGVSAQQIDTGIVDNDSEVEDNQQIMEEITTNLRLVSYEVNDVGVAFTVESDVTQTITVTTMTEDEFRWDTYTISAGQTTIQLDEEYSGVGIGAGGVGKFINFDISVWDDIWNAVTYMHIFVSAGVGAIAFASSLIYWIIRNKKASLGVFYERVTDRNIDVGKDIIGESNPVEFLEKKEKEQLEENNVDNSALEIIINALKTKIFIFALLIISIVVGHFIFGLTVDSFPTTFWVVFVSFIAFAPLSYISIPFLNEKYDFWNPKEDLIIDIGISESHDSEIQSLTDLPIHFYECTPSLAETVNIDGKVRTHSIGSGTMYMVKSFDPHTLQAEAADLGEIPEYQLLAFKEAIIEHTRRGNRVIDLAYEFITKFNSSLQKVEFAHYNELSMSEREMNTYGEGSVANNIINQEFPQIQKLQEGKAITDEYAELIGELDNIDDNNENSEEESGENTTTSNDK